MVVDPRKPDRPPEPVPSKKALMISIGVHLVVFILVIFGLPHWKTETIIAEPVPVELIANVGELTTTNKPRVEAPKPEEPKPEPPKKTEEPKKPEPKKDATPPPPAEDSLKAPPEPKDKPKDKAEKKPEPKKEEKKPEPKKEDNQAKFEDLLKDLTPEEPQQPDTTEVGEEPTDSEPTPNISRFSDVLSISEMDALRQQLSQCWSIMSGAANAEDQVVELAVQVNPDRTVLSARVVDQGKYNSNPFFRAAADSAMRAMRNPNCNPLNVPPDKYDQWKNMRIVFDPKEMF
jgi:hypothetical protein